jgi:CheY-like chemotaxis protein
VLTERVHLAGVIRELGENFIKANSGREALEHLLKIDIAIVLMDVSMRGINGFELVEIIGRLATDSSFYFTIHHFTMCCTTP